MLQSTFFDPVLGLDTHIVGVPAPPAPVPVPTPIPMPFVGLVFDPVGMAIGAAVGMALGSGPGIVLVNSMPVTNCGTDVTNKLTMPHIPAPGVMFIPPPMPKNDAMLFFGSLNVSLAGSYGVRLGDVALSCSDPVRLPTSVVMAIPKGPPVLNMAPMVPDVMAIAMSLAVRGVARVLGAVARRGAALFRKFRSGSAFFERVGRALGGCDAPSGAGRWRQMWSRGVRFLTGHPVDVVTGNLFTSAVDVELPGPLPLTIERVYESAGSGKATALGYGWNHSLDESLWFERGRAVLRCGDGREIEFPLWDLPDRTMRPGDALERVIHKLTLRCVEADHYEVEHSDGRIHEFVPVAGGDARIARLVQVRSRDGYHAIRLYYDERGLLDRVSDSGGRVLRFEHDARGRLVALKLPIPHGRGWYRHREYFYDAQGDLVEVKDAMGHAWRYLYQSHLLVQETDRNGLSFYFQYDGVGSNAKCVRTWGDGGIYDHVIQYDGPNRKTIVENSFGASTIYAFNVRNQVVAVTNPLGATTRYEYDPDTGGQTVVEDPLGARITQRYDRAGNLVEIVAPDGGTTRIEYKGYLPTHAIDSRGGESRWAYDTGGRLIERTLPTGKRAAFLWEHGLLTWLEDAAGQRMLIKYDEQKSISAIVLPTGAVQRYDCDNLGRTVRMMNQRGGVTRIVYDAEDRAIEVQRATGVLQRTSYDPEGNIVELKDSARHMRIGYGHFRRALWREEAGARLEFTYDTEGSLTAVVNEAGEHYTYLLDPVGGVLAETAFDGRRRTYVRDPVGRVTRVGLPSGRATEWTYDTAGRLQEVRHSDGTFARYTYGAGGLMLTAENESALVELERDTAGRVIVERVNGREVRSRYDARGHRVELTSSLGVHTAIDRDPLGKVRGLFFGPGRSLSDQPDVYFERDSLGLETGRDFASGLRVEWDRDRAGRPTARRTWTRSATDSHGIPNAHATLLDDREYYWGADEQIAAVVGSADARHYDYDARGRPVAERRNGTIVVRAMDQVGNIYRSPDGRDRRYGPGGRLEVAEGVLYDHDEDGNQSRKVEPGGATWAYRWNGHGMLTQLDRPDGTRLHFQYDAFARRVARETVGTDGAITDRTAFVWDDHVVLHEVECEDNVVTWHWEPETFTPVAKEEGGRRWSIVTDHVGTPTEMYDDGGRLGWKMHLDVSGVPRVDVGSARDCPWRWSGQYAEPDIASTYNLFRWFEIPRASYISPDPTGLSAGTHFYAYVDNPLLQIDPLGLDTHIGDAGERAAKRYLEDQGYEVIGGIQNPSGHGIDMVYRDPATGRVHVAEVKANSATASADQARGADSFGRTRLTRSQGWDLDAEGLRAQQALQDWVDQNPTKRVTGLFINTEVTVDSLGRARGRVTGVRPWTCS